MVGLALCLPLLALSPIPAAAQGQSVQGQSIQGQSVQNTAQAGAPANSTAQALDAALYRWRNPRFDNPVLDQPATIGTDR